MLILKRFRETGLSSSLKKSDPLVYYDLFQLLAEFDTYGTRFITNNLGKYIDVIRARIRGEVIFTLEPSKVSFFAALFNSLRYLCWSVPRSKIRFSLWVVFVNLCHTIIVNDSITQREVEKILFFRKSRVHFVKYGVDLHFFNRRPSEKKYILILGDAFRNDEYLERLVKTTNYVFCRLTRRQDTRNMWKSLEEKYPNRVRIEYRVPHSKLPEIYNGAIVTLLPIIKKNEPAGLTCLLQSLAVGVPVLTDSLKTGGDYLSTSFLGEVVDSLDELDSRLVERFNHLSSGLAQDFEHQDSWESLKNEWYGSIAGGIKKRNEGDFEVSIL